MSEAPSPGPGNLDPEGPEDPRGRIDVRRMDPRFLGALAVGAWAGGAVVSTSLGVPGLLTPAIFSAVLLLFPILAIAQAGILPELVLERREIYLSTIQTLFVIGILSAAALVRWEAAAEIVWEGIPSMRGPEATLLNTAVWAAVLTGAGLILVGIFHILGRAVGWTMPAWLRRLMPRLPDDAALFVAVSFSAGIFEEVAFRGVALCGLLAVGVDPVWAVGVSSLAFGAAHAYQGALGAIRAGTLGVLLSVPVLMGAGLVPVMIAHTALDLVAGFVLGDVLAGDDDDPPGPGPLDVTEEPGSPD